MCLCVFEVNMINAQQAVGGVVKPIEIDRMLIIADQKVKQAILNKQSSCVILFSKDIYSDLHLREFSRKVSSLGYFYYIPFCQDSQSRSNIVELRW